MQDETTMSAGTIWLPLPEGEGWGEGEEQAGINPVEDSCSYKIKSPSP